MEKSQKGIFRRGLTGFLTGVCNGLFGAGGGIAAVLALEKLCGMEKARAHATAIAIVAPLCAVSGIIYLLNGRMDWTPVPYVVPALMAGSFVGAKLLGKLRGVWINRIFCVIMFAAGIRMAI